MIRVFLYLAWRSAANRVKRQLRQLRSPRYLAALVLGAAYLYIVAVEQRPRQAPPVGVRWLEVLGALGVAGAVLWGWIFGVERRVLAFSPAEVTFLFAGPVARRGLVQYKLLRNQLLILFNALLWTLILSHERFGASPWLRAVSIWVLLTTLSFHRLGASFVRTSLLEHGRIGLRHRVVSLVVLGGALIAVAWSIQSAFPTIAAGWEAGVGPFLDAITEAAAEPVPHLLLTPFRAMVRPLAARTPVEWLQAIGPALLLLVLHYVWVIRADTAFEEAAAEASLRRAGRRTGLGATDGRGLVHRSVPRLLRLAPLGWPAAAILWKNLLAVARTRRARNAAVAFVGAGAVAALLSFGRSSRLAEIAGWFAATWAGLAVVIGPQWIRNDLRNDLLKLDLLRSYPLRGRAVVGAEAAASTLVLTVLQLALLAVAYLAFLGNREMGPDLATRSAVLLGAAACLPGVNYLGMLIQNATALLLPAWVHLGMGRPGGVEALGQNMLMIVAYLTVLAAALAIPVALAVAVFGGLEPALGWWAALPAWLVLQAAVVAEAVVALRWLGGVFDRTDPAAAGIAA